MISVINSTLTIISCDKHRSCYHQPSVTISKLWSLVTLLLVIVCYHMVVIVAHDCIIYIPTIDSHFINK
jgi:hypothetical protein